MADSERMEVPSDVKFGVAWEHLSLSSTSDAYLVILLWCPNVDVVTTATTTEYVTYSINAFANSFRLGH
jgi:hypothetical protein